MAKTKDTKEPKLTPKDYDRWEGRIGIKVISRPGDKPADKKGGKKDA